MYCLPLNMDLQKLIDIIKSQRIKKGISQKKLAEMVGMQRYEINGFEAGRMNIKYNRLIAILDVLYLKLNVKELITIEKDTTQDIIKINGIEYPLSGTMNELINNLTVFGESAHKTNGKTNK